jgi:hypothetical protein
VPTKTSRSAPPFKGGGEAAFRFRGAEGREGSLSRVRYAGCASSAMGWPEQSRKPSDVPERTSPTSGAQTLGAPPRWCPDTPGGQSGTGIERYPVDHPPCAEQTRGAGSGNLPPSGGRGCQFVHDEVVGFCHQWPTGLLSPEQAGDWSADDPPAVHVMEDPDTPVYQPLRKSLETEWVPQMTSLLDLDSAALPVIWDADFCTDRRPTAASTATCCVRSTSALSGPTLRKRRPPSRRQHLPAYGTPSPHAAEVRPPGWDRCLLERVSQPLPFEEGRAPPGVVRPSTGGLC